MTWVDWFQIACFGVVIVCSTLSIIWNIQAIRNWREAERLSKQTTEMYRRMAGKR